MSITVFDSHCHLQDAAFDEDREAVYTRARSQGVGLVIPGYTWESSEAASVWAQGHQDCWALVGVHPHDATTYEEGGDTRLEELAAANRVIGIGEIGLDYHYDHSPRRLQREVFRRQLELARRLGLPVSVHSRDAEEDTLAIIRDVGAQGVLHCFTGSPEFAEALLECGWWISVAGVVTFKNAAGLRDTVKLVPLTRLLIETDAPYLSPVPWRGQRNEPLRVLRVAEVVAAQKDVPTKEVFRATTSNVHSLFRRVMS